MFLSGQRKILVVKSHINVICFKCFRRYISLHLKNLLKLCKHRSVIFIKMNFSRTKKSVIAMAIFIVMLLKLLLQRKIFLNNNA